MKKKKIKKKWIIIAVVALIVIIGALGSGGESEDTKDTAKQETTQATEETEATEPESDKSTDSETKADKNKDSEIVDYNKDAAWRAVDQYCRNDKGWKATEFRKDKVIFKDGQYYVYVKRDMVDGSEGLFQYILKPSKVKDDGTSDLFTLVEDSGQVFEYIK